MHGPAKKKLKNVDWSQAISDRDHMAQLFMIFLQLTVAVLTNLSILSNKSKNYQSLERTL
jgi:hypothetical protein